MTTHVAFRERVHANARERASLLIWTSRVLVLGAPGLGRCCPGVLCCDQARARCKCRRGSFFLCNCCRNVARRGGLVRCAPCHERRNFSSFHVVLIVKVSQCFSACMHEGYLGII